MLPFATEFPVKPIDNAAPFVAQLIAWLRGIQNSTILKQFDEEKIENEYASFSSEDGETLIVREFKSEDRFAAAGFRHDIPDGKGRNWRTEVVLRKNTQNPDQDLIRVRTQCIATDPNAKLEVPKKPYIAGAF